MKTLNIVPFSEFPSNNIIMQHMLGAAVERRPKIEQVNVTGGRLIREAKVCYPNVFLAMLNLDVLEIGLESCKKQGYFFKFPLSCPLIYFL